MTADRWWMSFWGSLGASGMNRAMVDFLALEAEKEPFHHIHGAGKDRLSGAAGAAAGEGRGPEGPPGAAGAGVHLRYGHRHAGGRHVLCRAGASTISELTALGSRR